MAACNATPEWNVSHNTLEKLTPQVEISSCGLAGYRVDV